MDNFLKVILKKLKVTNTMSSHVFHDIKSIKEGSDKDKKNN